MNLKRLPNGYKQQVIDRKSQLNKLVKAMENLTDVGGYEQSLETKLSSFSMHVSVTNKYTDTNGELHIAFDSGIIGTEALVNTKTKKWRLSKTCTVFIPHTEDFVDNYSW